MARLRFKNFSNLTFIQSIDKPRHLRPLLEPFAEYFSGRGIDVTALKNNDKSDRQLLSVFTQPDEEMPANLLESLYVLDDLADEPGHDRILTEAQRLSINLDGIGDDLNPAEFAIAVYRHKPDLIHHCHEKTMQRTAKNYYEFQSSHDKKLSLGTAGKKRPQVEKELGAWFKKLNRTEACEIHVYEEDGEIKFQVTHGRIYVTHGTIDKTLKRSRVAYRPQKHDSVIYNNKTFVLKVSAQTPAERDKYRCTFGKILFGDAEHFPGGNMYTLDPLKRPDFDIRITPGVEAARLVEVCIEVDDADHFVQISKGVDILARAKRLGNPNLAEGEIVRGALLVKYSSGGRARRLEVRPPNVAIYDRDRDAVPAERLMRKNGLLRLSTNDDGA